MPATTRLVGFVLIGIGLVGYFATGGASLTALIPAMLGAVMLVLALVARSPEARKHAIHAAVAIALLSVLGTLPRLFPAMKAREFQRPAVVAQAAMVLVLAFYVLLGVKSFIDARRTRRT
jgi:phosphatidylserine synthase